MASLELFRNAEDARTFGQGETVFKAGDAGNEMFVIIEGAAEVLAGDRWVATLGPGDIVGEMALIDDDHLRTANVRAISTLKVAPVDRRQFAFLLRNHPSFGFEVMKTMADRLRRMTDSVVSWG